MVAPIDVTFEDRNNQFQSDDVIEVNIDARAQGCAKERVARMPFELRLNTENTPAGVVEGRLDIHVDAAHPARGEINRVRATLHRSYLVPSVHQEGRVTTVWLTNWGDRSTQVLHWMDETEMLRLPATESCEGRSLAPGEHCTFCVTSAAAGSPAKEFFLDVGRESPATVRLQWSAIPSASLEYYKER